MDDWLILTTVFNTGIDRGLDIDSSRDLAIAEWFVAKKEHEASWLRRQRRPDGTDQSNCGQVCRGRLAPGAIMMDQNAWWTITAGVQVDRKAATSNRDMIRQVWDWFLKRISNKRTQ